MRILYLSDHYAHGVMGTKRSIKEEMERRGHIMVYQDKARIGDILGLIRTYNPDQVWFAHSFLQISAEIKKKISIPLVGFGFSDPNNFSKRRLEAYDAYITNHYETFLNIDGKLPCHYNPTACDLRFHKNLGLKRDIDVSFMGVAIHPYFKNKTERVEIISRLEKEVNFTMSIRGDGWLNEKIEGKKFLEIINRSRIGLDIQDAESPLAHRMFEYSACGTPVITRDRPEVRRVFEPAREIIVYTDYDDMKRKLIYYLNENLDMLNKIGFHARKRCLAEHDISHRVTGILNFLDKNLGSN